MNKEYRFRFTQMAAVILLASLAAGCGQPKAAVSGSVTLDGRPLEIHHRMKGTVVFHAAAESQAGQVQSAAIDKEGRFQIKKSQGMLPGNYAVTVKVVEINPATDDEPAPSGTAVTPAKYGSPDTSGLEFEISAGENTIEVPLVSEETEEADEPPSEQPEATSPEASEEVPAEESEAAPSENDVAPEGQQSTSEGEQPVDE